MIGVGGGRETQWAGEVGLLASRGKPDQFDGCPGGSAFCPPSLSVRLEELEDAVMRPSQASGASHNSGRREPRQTPVSVSLCV